MRYRNTTKNRAKDIDLNKYLYRTKEHTDEGPKKLEETFGYHCCIGFGRIELSSSLGLSFTGGRQTIVPSIRLNIIDDQQEEI